MPRPQVRSGPDEGLLPAFRLLQQYRRPGPRWQLGPVGSIVKVPSAEQKAALEKADKRIAAIRRRLPLRRSRPLRLTIQPRMRARVSLSSGAITSGSTTPCPRAPSPQGDGPWEFVTRPDHPVASGQSALRITAQGLKQRFFDNAGRKLKVGEGDTLLRSGFP